MSIYFVFEVLGPSKQNYLEMEKVLYVILMAYRKLRHYFQLYNITVPLPQPLKYIIRNREAIAQVGKWTAELNEVVIDFVHHSSIQSQALTDFIADWTPKPTRRGKYLRRNLVYSFCDGFWGVLEQVLHLSSFLPQR